MNEVFKENLARLWHATFRSCITLLLSRITKEIVFKAELNCGLLKHYSWILLQLENLMKYGTAPVISDKFWFYQHKNGVYKHLSEVEYF